MQQHKCITLTTDFGLSDGFVGAMHGVIYTIAPAARVIDLCHFVPPQNITTAQFLIQHHRHFFPEKTIHVIVVDPGVGSARKVLLAKTQQACFIAPDNGVLSFLNEENATYFQANNPDFWLSSVSNTFHGRDIFAPLAAHLAQGVSITEMFSPISKNEVVMQEIPKSKKRGNAIHGKIIYADQFGNLISNIKRDQIEEEKSIQVAFGAFIVDQISKSYDAVKSGEPVALFNSFDCLEISINRGRAIDRFTDFTDRSLIVTWS